MVSTVTPHVSRVPAVVSIVFLILAVVNSWPYGFYTLLRLVVCGSAAYLAVQFHSQSNDAWTWAMAGVALLFNPVLPVGLGRDMWVPIDAAAAVVFALAQWKAGRHQIEGAS